jgi:hydroxyethylthiazole kinase
VPLVLDPVGAGASALRREVSHRLVAERTWTIIRGNLSEISTIAGHQASGRGVDSNAEVNIEQLAPLVKNWSRSLNATVAVTGPTDVISDGSDVILVHNGHPLLPSITGTGCMVTALTGAFAGANPKTPLLAATGALLAMGVAGELAAAALGPEEGPGTLRVRLIDALSRLTPDLLIRHGRVEYART